MRKSNIGGDWVDELLAERDLRRADATASETATREPVARVAPGAAARVRDVWRALSATDPGVRADIHDSVAERAAESRQMAAEARELRRDTGQTRPGDRLPLGEFLRRRRERRLTRRYSQDDGPMSR